MSDDMRIIPERDEIRARPQSNTKRPAGATSPKSSGADKPAARRPASSGGDKSFWVLIALILVACTASAWLFVQTRTLAAERDALAQRVEQIESRLSVTDESLSESGAAMQSVLQEHSDELELHMSEIRKLWGVAYDRNRPAIEELRTEQENMAARMNSFGNSLAQADPIIQGYEGMQSRLETISSQLLVQSATLDDLSARTRSLADRANNIESGVQSQRSTIQEHEEAIEAIDEYRLQINQRLLRLEQSLPSGG
jgi:chromosome segregation ATPase